jgi:hypothetical protein
LTSDRSEEEEGGEEEREEVSEGEAREDRSTFVAWGEEIEWVKERTFVGAVVFAATVGE